MGTEERHVSCHHCGKGVNCSAGKPPCEVLKGWLTVSFWKGSGSVEHYNFCSFSCLQSWVNAKSPQIPEVFLESFKEDES